MSSPAYTLGDIMSWILTAVQNIIGEIGKALAENATVVAQVIVLGGLALSVATFGRRVIGRISGMLRGIV